MKAELVPENGDPPIPITRDVTVVGRREFCDVQIDHPGLSKRHCVLVRTSGLLVVRDLATTNGTKVKGQRIRWAALLPGDRLNLGGYKMRVYLGPDHVPSPSEARAAWRPAGSGPEPEPEPEPIHLQATDVYDEEEILDAELAEEDTEWDGVPASRPDPPKLDLADLED